MRVGAHAVRHGTRSAQSVSSGRYTLVVPPLTKKANQRRSMSNLGGLTPRYSFVLHRDVRDRFTRCPRCRAHTRLRKLPLLIHVDHPTGSRLTILGKTCRLCIVCEMLIAHEADISRLLIASGVAVENETPAYVVLGTVDPRVWRAGLARSVTLDVVRASTADFKQYMRVDVTPAGWYRDADVADSDAGDARAEHAHRRRRRS